MDTSRRVSKRNERTGIRGAECSRNQDLGIPIDSKELMQILLADRIEKEQKFCLLGDTIRAVEAGSHECELSEERIRISARRVRHRRIRAPRMRMRRKRMRRRCGLVGVRIGEASNPGPEECRHGTACRWHQKRACLFLHDGEFDLGGCWNGPACPWHRRGACRFGHHQEKKEEVQEVLAENVRLREEHDRVLGELREFRADTARELSALRAMMQAMVREMADASGSEAAEKYRMDDMDDVYSLLGDRRQEEVEEKELGEVSSQTEEEEDEEEEEDRDVFEDAEEEAALEEVEEVREVEEDESRKCKLVQCGEVWDGMANPGAVAWRRKICRKAFGAWRDLWQRAKEDRDSGGDFDLGGRWIGGGECGSDDGWDGGWEGGGQDGGEDDGWDCGLCL